MQPSQLKPSVWGKLLMLAAAQKLVAFAKVCHFGACFERREREREERERENALLLLTPPSPLRFPCNEEEEE